ncbi:hypothetical protein FIBSPDRAFT_1035736 [Athelia psychrophila]|uniref:CST complex subunit STN1 n=1 Tax=Athelia psychrophila TaxID=1759441 RepID=A0A166WG25_9AGAM|nr:hypothetical protein FIBSPDRAFT_1035736 [Fibularhizoctonia sp. CBS 109695]
MSYTTTLETSSSSSILLRSPSKRRRLSLSPKKAPSSQELWRWTFSNEAIAPCRVRDVFAMAESESKDADFFWLARVPCRVVRLVAMVVGIQVYEKRIAYTIDDGSGVIECIHRPVPPSPQKQKHKPTQVIDKYRPIKPAPTVKTKVPEPPADPVPVASVGTSVRIIGKVMRWHDSRQIRAEIIEPCTSATEELVHWRTVAHLHKSSYSLPGPFVIPPPSSTSNIIPTEPQSTSHAVSAFDIEEPPSSPMTASSVSSSAHTSPTKAKPANQPQSPPRLRHPSRLHSRDLTANTFRIYLKHFMDNAPLHSSLPIDEANAISFSLSQVPSTPTRTPRNQARVDLTPRAVRPLEPLRLPGLERTPRAALKAPAVEEGETTIGFTMSYLRRVPELADMARRVVKAEVKRRAREERHRAQTQSSTSSKAGTASKPTASAGPSSSKNKQPEHALGPKMKRLFQVAIIKLYEEGSVVLFDGPARSIEDLDTMNETSRLWKANTSTSTAADSTVFSSVSSITLPILASQDEDLGYVSDPPANQEEAYISLTPARLAPCVEEAIRNIMSRPPAKGNHPHSLTTHPPGPTKEEIATYLGRADARWARVGEWVVGDALDVLRREDRVWCVGKERWEVCL